MADIKELYDKPANITDMVVPILKGRVSIDEGTKEPAIAPEMIKEKTRIKTLLYLLGKKVVEINFPDLILSQHGASAKSIIKPLYTNKAQADGAFNTLKKEGVIDMLGKDGKEVIYHIPDHKVLYVVDILTNNK